MSSRRPRTKSQKMLESEESEKEWKTKQLIKPITKGLSTPYSKNVKQEQLPPQSDVATTIDIDMETIPSSLPNEHVSIKNDQEAEHIAV